MILCYVQGKQQSKLNICNTTNGHMHIQTIHIPTPSLSHTQPLLSSLKHSYQQGFPSTVLFKSSFYLSPPETIMCNSNGMLYFHTSEQKHPYHLLHSNRL